MCLKNNKQHKTQEWEENGRGLEAVPPAIEEEERKQKEVVTELVELRMIR